MRGLNTIGRFALRWLAPEGVADRVRRVRHRPPKRQGALDSKTARRNAELAGVHQGRRCFILATGPSVQTQDLSGLADELCIAVSHFALHEDIRRIDPAYHVVAPYHPPFDFDAVGKLFDSFRRYEEGRVTYLLGHKPYEYSVWDYLQRSPDQRKARTYFIDYGASGPLDEANHQSDEVWDLTARPFEPRTVIYSAIQAAAYMGCTEIYLLGCDHDYLTDMARVTNHHFYAEQDGASDAEHLSGFSTERWFKEYYLRWQQYRLMRQYLEPRGVTIYNATAGGMLDVFPRVELSDVLAEAPRREGELVAHVR